MAKARKRSRRKFNLRRVRVSPRQGLGTLGSNVALSTQISPIGADTFRAVSVKGVWGIAGLTVGEGPVVVGFAHSDYSVTEIKECLEAQAAIDLGDKVAQEQANRLVRVVGALTQANAQLNDGKPISTKLNWLIGIGDSINMFMYNDTSAALTTGANITFMGDMWIKDN